MFTFTQQRGFSAQELQACPGYLECLRSFAPALEGPEKEASKDYPKTTTQEEFLEEEVEIEEVAPVKKGRKPREKKFIKKMATYTTTKDDTPSSFMPTSIIAPPPSLVSSTPFEVIDTARSHCPPTLLSIPPNAFASSEYIARSIIQPNRHGIEPQALIVPSSISTMLSVKEKTGKNAQAWDKMLNFAKKVKFIIYGLVLMFFFHFTLSYKNTWHCKLFLNLKM
jgi:hypothetical protein